ncbi:MAG: precorrin-6A synthase (deacetylating) [Pelagimonas sp.]|jgi:precorrin-6A synthase|nr:precorrin-6A synthase (deacetylating) [Pelagimonas sp.]
MISDLWLVGIGTGNPDHLTMEGARALREADRILVPRKGPGKDDLAAIRHRIIESAGSQAEIVHFDYPVRDPSLPYQDRVARWHDEIAHRWSKALEGASGPVALLVWGDPSLYDSTLRIAERLDPQPHTRVFPGITSLQALTAAHAIPLNTINGPIHILTGRNLRDHGWPKDATTVAVMLDGEASFQHLAPQGLTIWWGAFLGMPEQVLQAGPLAVASDQIIKARQAARTRHGWLMDTYLLRRE